MIKRILLVLATLVFGIISPKAVAQTFGAYDVWVAATIPGPTPLLFFLDAGNNWSLATYPPPAFLHHASGSDCFPTMVFILSDTDLSSPYLVGSTIYVGYGISFDEMLTSQRYRAIFVVPTASAPELGNFAATGDAGISGCAIRRGNSNYDATASIPVPVAPASFAAAYNYYVVAVKGNLTFTPDNRIASVQRIDTIYSFTNTNRWELTLSGPLKPFLGNLSLQNDGYLINVLANAPASELIGAYLFAGWGTSPEQMISNGTYRLWGSML